MIEVECSLDTSLPKGCPNIDNQCEVGFVQQCNVADGNGAQVCGPDGKWSDCRIVQCRDGYFLAKQNLEPCTMITDSNDCSCQPLTLPFGTQSGDFPLPLPALPELPFTIPFLFLLQPRLDLTFFIFLFACFLFLIFMMAVFVFVSIGFALNKISERKGDKAYFKKDEEEISPTAPAEGPNGEEELSSASDTSLDDAGMVSGSTTMDDIHVAKAVPVAALGAGNPQQQQAMLEIMRKERNAALALVEEQAALRAERDELARQKLELEAVRLQERQALERERQQLGEERRQALADIERERHRMGGAPRNTPLLPPLTRRPLALPARLPNQIEAVEGEEEVEEEEATSSSSASSSEDDDLQSARRIAQARSMSQRSALAPTHQASRQGGRKDDFAANLFAPL
jgi:hypothetical protein